MIRMAAGFSRFRRSVAEKGLANPARCGDAPVSSLRDSLTDLSGPEEGPALPREDHVASEAWPTKAPQT